jgi:hypothetical protein
MQKIDIEIPGELLTSSDREINFEPLKGKTIIGLCGYAQSGKDTFGKMMVEKLSFKRISFGDALKKDLDEHMRPQVFNDLKNKGVDIRIEDVNFSFPRNIEIKEILRPYMIWFSELMKEINGIHHWTNRALTDIGESKKIVITDVRRVNELELFQHNKEQYKNRVKSMYMAEMPQSYLSFVEENRVNSGFDSLLIHINQFKLNDSDSRTSETIKIAYENWMFDHVLCVDSRIPDKENYRENYMYNNLLELVNKFPKYFI